MADKKVGDSAVVGVLSKLEVEIGKLREGLGRSGRISELGSLAASDSVNQSCNGICSDFDRFINSSEVEISRAVSAAAQYNIEQLQVASKLDAVADSINQGCNGIC